MGVGGENGKRKDLCHTEVEVTKFLEKGHYPRAKALGTKPVLLAWDNSERACRGAIMENWNVPPGLVSSPPLRVLLSSVSLVLLPSGVGVGEAVSHQG